MNKIMPQRTFSPRSFMGDRGISIDNFGRVLKNDLFDDDGKIVAPKPWKPSHSKSASNSKFVDENLFEEAGQEIQTIILHSFNILEDSDSFNSNYNNNNNNTQGHHHHHHHHNHHNNNTTSADILLTTTPTPIMVKPQPTKQQNSNNINLNSFSTINTVQYTTTIKKPIPNNSNNNNNNNNNNSKDNNSSNNTMSPNKTNSSENSNNSSSTNIDSMGDSFTSISTTIGNLIENYSQDSLIDLKIPFFSHSPCFSADPIPLTPPTRTHNPITLNQAFTNADSHGAEIGLLSISPPPTLHYKSLIN